MTARKGHVEKRPETSWNSKELRQAINRKKTFLRTWAVDRLRDHSLSHDVLVLKDACGQTGSGPTCCTNEIVNSYAMSLGHDLKLLFDAELGQLRGLLASSKGHVDRKWTPIDVVREALELLFQVGLRYTSVKHVVSPSHPSNSCSVRKNTIHIFIIH